DAIPGGEQIRAGLSAVIKIDAMPTPMARGGRYFFGRRTASEDYFSLYKRQGVGGKDELLIDPTTVSSDASISVEYNAVPPERSLMAYAVRRGGEDKTEICLFDITARRPLPDALPRGRPDLFGAIDCEALVLDILRFHKLLVGSWWVAEYGLAGDPK